MASSLARSKRQKSKGSTLGLGLSFPKAGGLPDGDLIRSLRSSRTWGSACACLIVTVEGRSLFWWRGGLRRLCLDLKSRPHSTGPSKFKDRVPSSDSWLTVARSGTLTHMVMHQRRMYQAQYRTRLGVRLHGIAFAMERVASRKWSGVLCQACRRSYHIRRHRAENMSREHLQTVTSTGIRTSLKA